MINNRIKNLILKFFFIVILIINLIKLERGIYSPSNYCYYPNLTNIELVVHSYPTYNLESFKYNSSLELKNVNVPYNFENLTINILILLFTTHYFIHQFSKNQQVYSTNQQILSILHTKNIWHQSSDDEPPHNNYC